MPKIEHLGSESLINHIDRIKPSYVLTGHIHSGCHDLVEKYNGDNVTKFACVSILDEQYAEFYKPLVIDFDK